MGQFNANIVERYGFKASQRGFFKKWQQLSSSIKESEDIMLCEAAEKAYNQIKLQGSE